MNNQSGVANLEALEALLERFDADAVSATDWLECSVKARALASRLGALAAILLGKAEAAGQSLSEHGTPMTSWLSTRGGLSKREAAGAVFQAKELARHQKVGEAAVTGRISINQARSITKVLDGLELDANQQSQAEQVMLGLADTHDTQELLRAAPQVLREVDPNRAEEALERKLQREKEAAWQNRSLRFHTDAGSLVFSGSLPLVEGAQWQAVLRAHVESRRRNLIEERDRLANTLTPEQRLADGFLAMIAGCSGGRTKSAVGGEGPRVMVLLDYEKLRSGAAGAGLIDGQPLGAGDLRRLCCDADLIPVVLGGPSEVLDVGRARRLVTPAIRLALIARDGGCVFPGCTTHPSACEAHHVRAWWAGGVTALENLVLLCHHHHATVEPAKYSVRDQWEIRIRGDGAVELIPPARFDPDRKPIPHLRPASRSIRSDAEPRAG